MRTRHALNPFQQAMALWEEDHPYNAGHVVHLRGRANTPLLGAAVQSACKQAGVGQLALDQRKVRYRYEPLGHIELREIKTDNSAIESLCRTITEELNTPFPHEPHHPVRWLVLDDPKTESHFLVAIYRHLAADFFSMRLLIGRVLNRYYQVPSSGDEGPLQVFPPSYTRLMGHHYRRPGVLKTPFQAIQRYFQLRHVYRRPERKDGSKRSQSLIFDAPARLIERLAAACKARQVTVNDAFLAALCAAIAETTCPRGSRSRRCGLAVAAVVDVRKEASEDLSNCFGLCLGQMVIIIDEEDTASVEHLLIRTTEEMRKAKAGKSFIGPHWNFVILVLLRRWFSLKITRARYLKHYPISAGLSNVRLDASWFAGATDMVLNYIRIGPTGPMLPIVLTPTTYGNRLNLGVTYRESSFTEAETRKLIDLFFEKLERLAANGKRGSSGTWTPS
jgi:NRPS condensation-like uncharacterized protein